MTPTPDPASDDSTAPDWSDLADSILARLVHGHRATQRAEALSDDEQGVLEAAEATYVAVRAEFVAALERQQSGFAALAANAGLTDLESEVLALAIACELDTRRQALVALLQGDDAATRLTLQTIGLALGGLDRCSEVLGPSSGLRRAALVEVAGDGPWARRTLVLPMALLWAFLGDTAPDPELPYGAYGIDLPDSSASPAALAVAPVVLAYGVDRVRRREAAMRALTGRRFLVSRPPDTDQEWAALVREATLTGRAVIIELDDDLSIGGRRRIDQTDHLAWALTAEREISVDDLPERPAHEITVPPSELTLEEWRAAFGDTPWSHRLTPQQAERARKVFDGQGGDIDAAVRRLLAGPLDSLAVRVRPSSSWDDLVLSPARLGQLRRVVSRYRSSNRVYDEWGLSPTPSRGLITLFAGPSGTGKTLAAEVLAGELGLDMFRLDLSSVVSKYIGETEKNLDRVFEAAGVGNVVLFFDEADALFGKRSEVRDARDRYANLEVSYLLQRIEGFDGVVVLATNFEKSIDDAFLRRIHTRIDFALPEEEERLAIWTRHLPSAALLDDVDFGWLARQFDLSGGQIRNAAVYAAFLAAGSDRLIGMEDLVRGVAQEFRKAGRLVRPEAFDSWHAVVAE